MRRRRDGAPLRAGDVVGVPVLPPGRITAVVTRLRASIATLHRRAAPAPLQILESVFGAVDHGALVALCGLGVPDALDRPMAIGELASRIGVDETALTTLVRYGAGRGWLHLDRRGRVGPTRVTRFLHSTHPGGWRSWVEFSATNEVQGAIAALPRAVREDRDAFALANGTAFFPYMRDHREIGRLFDSAMAAGGRLHGLALAAALDWSQVGRVCDVGGGNGSLLVALLGSVPHLHGVVLDLPEVISGALVADRLEVVGGDAFVSVPPGCDRYLLVNVVHDWDDERVVRLLRLLATTMPSGSRVIVVEGAVSRRPLDGVAARTDVLMLALAPGGRERTRDELGELARRSGLEVERVVHLASSDLAYVLAPRESHGGR